MGQALETVAQQSCIVPTMIFRQPESVHSYRMREGHFTDVIELEEIPRRDDEDKIEEFLQ